MAGAPECPVLCRLVTSVGNGEWPSVEKAGMDLGYLLNEAKPVTSQMWAPAAYNTAGRPPAVVPGVSHVSTSSKSYNPKSSGSSGRLSILSMLMGDKDV